jgi:hypothetical protein
MHVRAGHRSLHGQARGSGAQGFRSAEGILICLFPLRIFYLADDLRRPAGRVSVALATSSGRRALGG